MKKEFKTDIKIVVEVINRHDPMSILVDGQPEDEYNSEATRILSAVYKQNDLNDLRKRVREIFIKSFGIDPKYDLSYLDKMTKEIYYKLNIH